MFLDKNGETKEESRIERIGEKCCLDNEETGNDEMSQMTRIYENRCREMI